jgi:hypothetical protein
LSPLYPPQMLRNCIVKKYDSIKMMARYYVKSIKEAYI